MRPIAQNEYQFSEYRVKTGNVLLERQDIQMFIDFNGIVVPPGKDGSWQQACPVGDELFLIKDWSRYVQEHNGESTAEIEDGYIKHLIEEDNNHDWVTLMNALQARITTMARNTQIREGREYFDPIVIWNTIILAHLARASKRMPIPDVLDTEYKRKATPYNRFAIEANGFLQHICDFFLYNLGKGQGSSISIDETFLPLPTSRMVTTHLMSEQNTMGKIENGSKQAATFPSFHTDNELRRTREEIEQKAENLTQLAEEIGRLLFAQDAVKPYKDIFKKELHKCDLATITLGKFVECIQRAMLEVEQTHMSLGLSKEAVTPCRMFEAMQMPIGNIIIFGYSTPGSRFEQKVPFVAVIEQPPLAGGIIDTGEMLICTNPTPKPEAYACRNDFDSAYIPQNTSHPEYLNLKFTQRYLGLDVKDSQFHEDMVILASALHSYALPPSYMFGKLL